MCTVLLPPGDNPIAVNKYININIYRLSAFTLIFMCWPEDGRNAVETCSQKLLNVLALTTVYFIILLLCLT